MSPAHAKIISLYEAIDEDNRFASRHGSVEYLTTMWYIDQYLRPGGRVLEIGAATGRYSHALARRGFTVDAVELVERNIEVFRRNTEPDEPVSMIQGDALDLSRFADETYDLTLLLGPLYHLFNQDDKRQALGEAIRVTKTGGVIFASYIITDGVLTDDGFAHGRTDIPAYVAQGFIDPQTFAIVRSPEELFEIVRKPDIDDLMSVFPVTRLRYVATDGLTMVIREAVDAMDDATFDWYLRYHFASCECPDMVGVTSHSLDSFRKD